MASDRTSQPPEVKRPAVPQARPTAEPLAVAVEIARLIRDELAFPEGPPALDEPLAERLDSLQLLTLAVAVEDRFHVVLSDDEAAAARSLADLGRIVAARAPPERLPRGEAPP